MTKKYYYTDPLAAAWMSKHFNINIEWADGTISDDYTGDNIVYYEKHLGTESPYYIHPDSVHILNPQVGDVIYIKLDGGGVGIWETVDAEDSQYSINRGGKIIQRNNTAFMWPEVEEINDEL